MYEICKPIFVIENHTPWKWNTTVLKETFESQDRKKMKQIVGKWKCMQSQPFILVEMTS